MKRFLTVLVFICLICIGEIPGSAFAQTDDITLTDEGNEQKSEVTTDEEGDDLLSEEEKYTMWSDPLYFQFEKMMPQLAQSVGRLDTRISTLAVTEIVFSPKLNTAFRKVAEAKLLGQMLLENPRLKLIKCDECNRITSEVKNGILTLSRGLKDQKARRRLAEKLDVQGFINIMITEEERLLTIVINVHDAQEGRIVLSDVITGNPVPKARYWHIYAGGITTPVKLKQKDQKAVDQSAIMFGVEYSIRFAESWIVGSNIALYVDNNSEKGEKDIDYIAFSPGLMFDGTIAWELASLMQNNAALNINIGLGQFISPQFNFAVYNRIGLKMILGQRLTFSYSYFTFEKNNLDKPENGVANSLSGSATSIAFGYQF